MAARPGGRGVLVSVASSVCFGLIYYLTPFLAPLSGEDVWAIRTIASVPCIALVLLAMRGAWQMAEIAQRIRRTPLLLLGILVCGALLGAQVWVFAWAPLNGHGMDVALGYFLLPLVLVVVGRVLYRDRMLWWQWVAAGVAAVGVAYEIIRNGGIGWGTLLVAFGYPVYFVLRRAIRIDHLGGMWWENLVAIPLALFVVGRTAADGSVLAQNPALWWSAPGIAIFASIALALYVLASRLLPISLFGLLSYLEPALLLVASLLLGERIAAGEWFTYGAIWAAVLVLILGGIATLRTSRR